ncbi:MAG: hypothetical protein AAFY78_09480 [Cyanobacteria bacterium J06648_16]
MRLSKLRLLQIGLFAIATGVLTSGCKPDPVSRPTEPVSPPPTEGPPPPPPGAFLAQLQPDVNADLLALDIPVAIPTYLPPGFTLEAYEVGIREDGAGAGPYYGLAYRNAEDQCFAIEATSGGVAGPVLEQRLPIDSPLFGAGYVLYYGELTGLAAPAESAVPDLVSDWLAGDVALYRYAGAQLTMETYNQTGCIDLPPEEALKVVESLTYLTSDVYGDLGVPSAPGDQPVPLAPPAPGE